MVLAGWTERERERKRKLKRKPALKLPRWRFVIYLPGRR